MLKLDNNLLQELGLGSLPEEQKRAMLQHIYETLELRVGTNLANQMTDQQLEEFEQFIDSGGDANQAQALQWLESNLPNYKQVVNEVFEALKGEVKQMAPQIVASSQQQTAAMPQGQPAAPAPMTPQQQAYGQPPMPQVQPAVQPNYAQAPPVQQQYAQPQPQYQQSTAPMQPTQNPMQAQDFQAYQPMAGPQGMPQTFPGQPQAAQMQPGSQQPYPPMPPIGQNPQQQAAQQYAQPQSYQPAPPQNPSQSA